MGTSVLDFNSQTVAPNNRHLKDMMLRTMPAWCFLVIILVVGTTATPLPAEGTKYGDESDAANIAGELKPGDKVEQGDMILNKEEEEEAKENEITKDAEGIESQRGFRTDVRKWPQKTLYYDVSDLGYFDHPNFIRSALKNLEKRLGPNCIKFVESKSAANRVKVNPKGGCFSYEGMQGGEQIINLKFSMLGSSCKKVGIVQHEFLHALGFFHTQMRSDRDKYMTINEKRIKDSAKGNFVIYNDMWVNKFGLPLDLGSVLMYPKDAFSDGGNTITTKESSWQNKIGQRKGVSKQDVIMIRKAYDC